MSILVRHERRGPVFEIILDRPEKRNAIDLEMYEQFSSALAEAGQSDGVRALLIRGEGKVFSAGIDVMAFMQLQQNYGSSWLQKMRNITRDFQAVLNRLEELVLFHSTHLDFYN